MSAITNINMNSIPFSISPILVFLYVVIFCIGGLMGLMSRYANINGFTALFLCAFLSIPIGSYIRVFASRLLARFSGIKRRSALCF